MPDELDALNDELIKALDLAIFYERDRDQCARERDVYKAERDTLLEIARAAQTWRATWAIRDDAVTAVERRQKARRRLFAALDAWAAMGEGEK